MMNTKYIGKTYKNCDPSQAQQGALNTATSVVNTLKSSYNTVFGLASSIAAGLTSKLTAISASTSGLDPATLAKINAGTLARSAASENAAQAAVNAKGAAQSATPGVESGVTQMVRGETISNLETAKNTELNNTAIQNAELGVSERDKALSELQQVPNTFSSSNQTAGDLISATGEESTQANANAAASNSWMGLVGGIASSAAGGLAKGGFNLPSGGGPSGGIPNSVPDDPSSAGILNDAISPGWEAPGSGFGLKNGGQG
jgi:hypothetical protein